MGKISIEQIRELREATGLSVVECKKALEETGGNIEKAKEHLSKLGKQIAEKKQAREVGEGFVEAYAHSTGKLGAIVDVRCETDFVARSQDFKNFCHEIALQVASMDPAGVEELLKQPYVRDPSHRVQDIVSDVIAKVGENIVIKRFSRFEI
ncbi:MAG: translation elongation factor Ts [Candidatus Wildermuthbacteria bacterium]|nr:translation elongation factor Ts [Candidatus Wildermuthbacteria bacterium]